jgi:hypothetical protein
VAETRQLCGTLMVAHTTIEATMTEFEIVDVRPGADASRQIANGHAPDTVAASVLGEEVVRSGAPKRLIAKVYFLNASGDRNMVRFYRTAENAARLAP